MSPKDGRFAPPLACGGGGMDERRRGEFTSDTRRNQAAPLTASSMIQWPEHRHSRTTNTG